MWDGEMAEVVFVTGLVGVLITLILVCGINIRTGMLEDAKVQQHFIDLRKAALQSGKCENLTGAAGLNGVTFGPCR